ncbi:MAG TPA: BTAD domain-containing putative transcriptional regulator, partial [Solirubrobacteraceae bacterium]
MEFRVLGTVQVAGADGPRPLHGRKELAVLAYLLAHAGRSVPADELVWAVWGEDAPPTAQKSLQVRLSRLRSDLGDAGERIARDGGGYRLAVAPGELDAQRFERLVGEAAGRPPAEAAEVYERALALVRGRPYADVADVDALQSEIRRLEELRLAAVEGRLRALLELGRHGDAVPELDRAIEAEPLHEGLAALQMLALYRAGRQADALAAYRALARRLDDMGLEPSPQLRDLERRVLVQDPELAAPAAPAAAPTNLGARLTSFVGRGAELEAVRDRLADHRLVTLSGPGGVGKTSLATEAGRGLLGGFPGGVWGVELSALRNAGRVPAAIATAIGVAGGGLDPGGLAGALPLVVDHLRDRRALLILDNCEHLAAAVARLAEQLLRGAPALRILATSRQALGAAGEALLDVAPLEAPDLDAGLAELRGSDAVRLFVDRARAARPDFRLDEATARPVAAICAGLDGLPLALELAAARVRALSVAEIAARLDDRFRLLASARSGTRARTLEDVVAWSHDLLTEDERAGFRRLAIFRAAFTLADAERVAAGGTIDAADVADLLAALVERSMLRAGEDGYRMLHTLRAFGLERLDEAGERIEVADRHAAHFARRSRVAVGQLWTCGTDGVIADVHADRTDLAAAARHALRRGRADWALPLAGALGLLEYGVGEVEAARRRLDAALALQSGSPTDTLAAVRLHASMLLIEGRLRRGAEAVESAQLLAEQLGDEAEIDRTRAIAGLALLLARDAPAALRAFAGLEERSAARGERWVAGFVAGWTGFVSLLAGDLADARARAHRAVEGFAACGDLWGLLSASVNLGRAAMALGDYDEAARAYQRALAAAGDRIGDRVVPLLHDLGVVEVRRGALDRAADLWTRCAEAADRDLGTTGGWVLLTARGLRWYPLLAAGHLARMRGDSDEAARRYGEAQALLEDVERDPRDPIGLHGAMAITLLLRARLAEDAEHGEEATDLAREGLARAQRSGDRRLVARALDAVAAGLSLDGDAAEAAEALGRAEALRREAGG